MKTKQSKRSTIDEWSIDSYLNSGNGAYLENQYELYLDNPSSVPDVLQKMFAGWAAGGDVNHSEIRERFRKSALQASRPVIQQAESSNSKQAAVNSLIADYRRYGHIEANLDLLKLHPPKKDPRLSLEYHGLSAADESQVFNSDGVLSGSEATLAQINSQLKKTYSGNIGYEYQHITAQSEIDWFKSQIEQNWKNYAPTDEDRHFLIKQLAFSEGLEHYLDKRYVGQKRFSIEGLESLIPLLNITIQEAARAEIKTVAMGMAHRGRLNVMYNVAGMSAKELFAEFEGKADYGFTSGDVKYHLGVSSDLELAAGPVHVSLAFNPSHLEFINTVLAGGVRARQWQSGSADLSQAFGITIHGDAAFCGQGVVMESLNLSQLRGYTVGGMLRVVANNQVGFSTSDRRDVTSSQYCSDIAKMIDAPVFHVNADDPEAVFAVAKLAFAYRQQFKKDVVIDLVGYRRYGHQEIDEPMATQPLMYKKIKQHPTTYKQYSEKLVAQSLYTKEEITQLEDSIVEALDNGERSVKVASKPPADVAEYEERWRAHLSQDINQDVKTGITEPDVKRIGTAITTIPEDLSLVRPVENIFKARVRMAAGEQDLDWGYAELMAYASLLDEGVPIRFTGEDIRRGTFYHRHAYFFDSNTSEAYSPLNNISEGQASLQLYDSMLSEAGVMGYEYGYSLTDPKPLVIWEAQYGDFANGAQVIIDQFISSAWQKWQRLSGLVLLLPHGYEGAGPEHTSARLERFLQMCAQKNMQVCMPSTPAQMFHLLRRQVLRSYRLPLIVMTPKSLLRHKVAASQLSDLSDGCFQLIIPEKAELESDKIRRVILCSGKIYFDLLEAREKAERLDIAIIRIEQLYPFPYTELEKILQQYGHVEDIVWCQEEPKNQGAWYVSRDRLLHCLSPGQRLRLISRPPAAAPAAGYRALHLREQENLIDQAINDAEVIVDLD